MSRLRRLVLADRFFFVTCNLRRDAQGTNRMSEEDFSDLAAVITSTRESLKFLLTAWVFLPDHWHAVIFPRYPLTISKVMKGIKARSTCRLRRGGRIPRELWPARFYEHALRTVKEYHDCLRCLHRNPVKRGLVSQPEEWKWSSFPAYHGGQETKLAVDRVRLPADLRARI